MERRNAIPFFSAYCLSPHKNVLEYFPHKSLHSSVQDVLSRLDISPLKICFHKVLFIGPFSSTRFIGVIWWHNIILINYFERNTVFVTSFQ